MTSIPAAVDAATSSPFDWLPPPAFLSYLRPCYGFAHPMARPVVVFILVKKGVDSWSVLPKRSSWYSRLSFAF